MKILLASVLLLSSCGLFCPKPDTTPRAVVPQPLPEVKIVKTWSACLDVSPPTSPDFAPLPGNETPSPCEACFLAADSRALNRYLSDLETWAASAWARCNTPKPITKDNGGDK